MIWYAHIGVSDVLAAIIISAFSISDTTFLCQFILLNAKVLV
jgi:hypothetical protein